MTTEEHFTYTATDGVEVGAYRWSDDADPLSIVVINHGMGEHSGRYARLATSLNAAGHVVFAKDHRGHGRTAASTGGLGDLGAGGWPGLIADTVELVGLAKAAHVGLPVFMIGHSMGSFALQQYLLHHGHELAGAVLSGTSAIDVISAGIDPEQEVDLSAFNAPFEPARTEYDWLSRDPAEVDAYVADEWCGFGLDAAGAASMLASLAEAADPASLARVPPELPIYLVSGRDDPLAGEGELIDLVAGRYREAGLTDVTVAIYPEARHEVFNETNRDEITAALVTWLDRVRG